MNAKSHFGIFLLVVLGFSLFQPNLHMLTHHHEHEEVHMCSEDHSDEGTSFCHHEMECELCSHFAQQASFTISSGHVLLDIFETEQKPGVYSNPWRSAHILLPPTRGSPLRS